MPDTATSRLERVLAQLRLYEHPLLNFSARAKGEGVELIIQFKDASIPVHTYYLRSASARSRSPAVRMELPAAALRCAARLLRGNVHPHAAGPRRPAPERIVSSLRQKIEQEIRERGPIPFSRYMELCLYDPKLGYYSRSAEQFGKAGDFYTSSDVHAVFGRLLARQFDEMWRALGSPDSIRSGGTRAGPWLVRARRAGLVGEKVSGFLSRFTLRSGREFLALRRRIEGTLALYIRQRKS